MLVQRKWKVAVTDTDAKAKKDSNIRWWPRKKSAIDKSHRKLTEISLEPGHVLTIARPQTNLTLVPAVRPSTLAKAAVRSAASQYGDQLENWLNHARWETLTDRRVIQDEYPFVNSPSVIQADASIVPLLDPFKTAIARAVSNKMALIGSGVIFALQSCTAESGPSPTGIAVPTAKTATT